MFWASEQRSSEEAVHYQGLQVELARPTRKYSAGLMIDLQKAYEHVRHDKLPTALRSAKPFPPGAAENVHGGVQRTAKDGGRWAAVHGVLHLENPW